MVNPVVVPVVVAYDCRTTVSFMMMQPFSRNTARKQSNKHANKETNIRSRKQYLIDNFTLAVIKPAILVRLLCMTVTFSLYSAT